MPAKERKSFLKKGKGLIKNRGIFLKYFVAFLVLEFICFAILGISFSVFGANNWFDQTRNLLHENSKNVSALTTEVLETRINSDLQGSIFMLCNNISMISKAIDADIYVCNLAGDVILCKDLVTDEYEIVSDGKCIVHSMYHIPAPIISEAEKGEYSNTGTTLGGVYSKEQIVAADPIVVNDKVVAIVFAATPASTGAASFLSSTLKAFLLASAFSLLIGAVAIYFFINNILSPLKDMSNATKSYAMGDFSYRVRVRGGRELESLLREFNKMASNLAMLESSRRSFVANVSHELKTPMTTIGGFIDGILDGTIPPEKQEHYLEIVSNETKRLSRLVVAMLNLSKIEEGELNLNPKQFNITNDIINVLISFEQQIEHNNIEIKGLDTLEPLLVNADEDMIHQVIYNLVDNAVKFTKNGTITASVAKNSDNSATVTILNTGSGISSEELSKIFERFYKVDKSRSFDTKSAGLGLYIVKTIIEMHGGSVKADSVENEYTAFSFTLPEYPQPSKKT